MSLKYTSDQFLDYLFKKTCIYTFLSSIFANFSLAVFKTYLLSQRSVLFERQSYGKRGGSGVFCLLVHSPNGHNDKCWATSKPGAPNSFWVSCVDDRGPMCISR